MKSQRIIRHQDLICMDEHTSECNYRIDLAYARDDNLLFGERIYKEDAKLWLYKDLAKIVFIAARQCFEKYGMRFVLYDGLRTIDAQSAMMQTKRVIENPHWLEEPRMLSPAGAGGHPRGMAIDIGLEDSNGKLLDMGSAFDCFSEQSHREYPHPTKIMDNRSILNESMIYAAKYLNIALVLLPQEWWDFRLPRDIYEQYAPLSDSELPQHMRLVDI